MRVAIALGSQIPALAGTVIYELNIRHRLSTAESAGSLAKNIYGYYESVEATEAEIVLQIINNWELEEKAPWGYSVLTVRNAKYSESKKAYLESHTNREIIDLYEKNHWWKGDYIYEIHAHTLRGKA